MNLMNWEKCKREFVRKVEIDNERIESLKEQAQNRLLFIKQQKDIDNKKVSFVVEAYYETIKELLVAYLLKNGLKSDNHQCLITFFYKNNPDYEAETNIISQMSYFRNRLDYYGEAVPLSFFENNKEEFEKIIKILFGLIEK